MKNDIAMPVARMDVAPVDIRAVKTQGTSSADLKPVQVVEKSAGSQPQVATQNNEQVSSEKLQEVVESLNSFVQQVRRELQFNVDESTGKTIVKVIASDTNEVIRQIPSEEVLDIARRIGDMAGVLLQEKA